MRSYRKADGDTDHYLVTVSFKIESANNWNLKKPKVKAHLDIEKTKNVERVKVYQRILNDELTK